MRCNWRRLHTGKDFEKSSSVYHCFFCHHVCLSNLKHAPSCELPQTTHKTVFRKYQQGHGLRMQNGRITYIPPPPPPQRGPQGLINLHLLQVTANGNCSTSCTLYNIFNFSHTRLVHDIMPDHLWNLKWFTC